jgi:hypothetical protein
MATTTQSQDHALLFLSNHSLAEAKHFGLDVNKETLNHDPAATITVTGSEVVVKYNPAVATQSLPVRTFTSKPPYSYYTCAYYNLLETSIRLTLVAVQIPDTTRTGHLYFRGHPPASGDSEFWIQQYPPYFGGEGRLIVEFWTGSRISAIVSPLIYLYFYTQLIARPSPVQK